MSLSLSCATRKEERRKEAKTMAKVNLDDKLDKTVVGGDMVVKRMYKEEDVQVYTVDSANRKPSPKKINFSMKKFHFKG